MDKNINKEIMIKTLKNKEDKPEICNSKINDNEQLLINQKK